MEIISIIARLLEVIVACASFVLAVYLYIKELKNKRIKTLAQQVIAYYCEEQEAVKEISQYTNENAKTIKMRLRDKAESNADNANKIRPSMTTKGASEFI